MNNIQGLLRRTCNIPVGTLVCVDKGKGHADTDMTHIPQSHIIIARIRKTDTDRREQPPTIWLKR